jgi:hypothetical protein
MKPLLFILAGVAIGMALKQSKTVYVTHHATMSPDEFNEHLRKNLQSPFSSLYRQGKISFH